MICSGQAAVITPRQVTGLGARRVKAVAAAKHHTVVATEGGEVFTWGSNRGKAIFIQVRWMILMFPLRCFPSLYLALVWFPYFFHSTERKILVNDGS